VAKPHASDTDNPLGKLVTGSQVSAAAKEMAGNNRQAEACCRTSDYKPASACFFHSFDDLKLIVRKYKKIDRMKRLREKRKALQTPSGSLPAKQQLRERISR
jgi:hypothetical protein